MPFMDSMGGFVRTLGIFALGRGLISTAVFAATMMGGGWAVALAVAAGGALLSGVMRLHSQAQYENGMVNLYRENIADRLKITPAEVTRAHLKQVAQDNEVIGQALERQSSMNKISFFTAALAGAVTFGLLSFGLPDLVSGFFAEHIANSTLRSTLQFASIGIVAGTSSLIVHDGLEALVGHKTGVNKAAAHDRIVEMERSIRRGWMVGKEHVYGVMVAGNPHLQRSIRDAFGKDYQRMGAREQAAVLEKIGVAKDMQLIADEINFGRLRPGNLAFMISDANAPYRARQYEQARAVEPERGTVQSYAQKLGLIPRTEQSFAAQLAAQKATGLAGPLLS